MAERGGTHPPMRWALPRLPSWRLPLPPLAPPPLRAAGAGRGPAAGILRGGRHLRRQARARQAAVRPMWGVLRARAQQRCVERSSAAVLRRPSPLRAAGAYLLHAPAATAASTCRGAAAAPGPKAAGGAAGQRGVRGGAQIARCRVRARRAGDAAGWRLAGVLKNWVLHLCHLLAQWAAQGTLRAEKRSSRALPRLASRLRAFWAPPPACGALVVSVPSSWAPP